MVTDLGAWQDAISNLLSGVGDARGVAATEITATAFRIAPHLRRRLGADPELAPGAPARTAGAHHHRQPDARADGSALARDRGAVVQRRRMEMPIRVEP